MTNENEHTPIHPELIDEREKVGKVSEEEKKAQDEEQLAINFLDMLRIHAKDRFEKPNFTLYRNGIGFAPLGNIMAICAEAKNGKSWLMQQFATAMLRGEFCGLTSEMENAKVLYFDTEQDKYDTKMIQTRMHYLMGWPFEDDNDRFQLYSMDDFDLDKVPQFLKDKPIQQIRMYMIEQSIKFTKPQVVFIDGVRDLIFDFNDLAESAVLVQKLMSLARRNNILICTVLHVNPNSDKMRGHLGTEMQNKTTDVFTVKKDDVNGVKQFKVKQIAARHQDVEDWSFVIDMQGKFAIPVLAMDENTSAAEAVASVGNDEVQARMMINAALSVGESLKFTTLRERIRIDNKIGSGRAKDIINMGVKLGMLTCADNTYTRVTPDTVFDLTNSMGDDTEPAF